MVRKQHKIYSATCYAFFRERIQIRDQIKSVSKPHRYKIFWFLLLWHASTRGKLDDNFPGFIVMHRKETSPGKYSVNGFFLGCSPVKLQGVPLFFTNTYGEIEAGVTWRTYWNRGRWSVLCFLKIETSI